MTDADKRSFQLSAKKRALLEAMLQQQGVKSSSAQRISRRGDNDSIPLSFAQTRLWFLDQLEPGNPVYNETTTIRLTGDLNLVALEQSINEIVRRHEALRTTFKSVDGQPVQVISPNLTITLYVEDLQKFPETERELQAQKFTSQEAKQPFNLAYGPLLRATLLRFGDRKHWLLLTMHHIVCDAWSMGIFFQEITALYEAFLTGKPSPLPELPIQYPDYAVWQRQWLQGEVLQSQLNYWKQQLSGNLPTLQLPIDRPRLPIQTYEGASQSLVLSEKLTQDLKGLSNQQGVSLFMTLLAAFKTLLYRYSGQEDVIVGSPIAGRNRIETENLIGFFLNSLVLRTNLSGNPSFRELLDRVRQVTLQAYTHQDFPFEKLVEELQPERDLSRNPFFDVMLNFINTPARTLTLRELSLSFQERIEPESKFSMTLYVEEHSSQLSLQLVYQRELFDRSRIICLLNQLEFLLEQIVANPNQPIESYSLVTVESASLLPDPSTVLQGPKYESIANTFLSWASTIPDQPAVCQGSSTWTYHQLAVIAQTLAQILLARDSSAQEVVAIFGPRCFGLIASMMGVLLSGKVLLTIDPNLPRERQRLMLQEAKAKCLIYVGDWRSEDEWMQHELPVAIVCITSDKGQVVPSKTRSPEAINLPQIAPDDAAYIFFTSGTTGVPKGVLGCHKGLSHFLAWQRQTFSVGPQDRTAQLTGLSFDVVLRDIFLPLTSGATLCLPEEKDDLTAAQILPWLDRQKISLLHTVPSLAQSWLVDLTEGVSLRTLQRVFFAGEPLTETLIRQWRKAFPEAGEIINLYGPTETTLAKCFYQVPGDVLPGVQPVGKPLPQTQALVLGANNQLCGIGEPGQIVIRTPYRSLGYINASEENQRRFLKNPFRNDPEDLLYFTGDRGRYRTDCSLEILGRIDRQVKIRGVRIEPGEIEAALTQHPSVRQTVVMAREDVSGDQRLVAYLIPHQQTITINELRRYLLQQIPDYMVPSAFVMLDTLPLTPNGKVDRKALPAPDLEQPKQEGIFVAPRTPTEEVLANMMAQVLGVKQVGIDDNFFALGGHSLLALQLLSKLREAFDLDLPVRYFFAAPTVADLAQSIEQERQAKIIGDRTEEKPDSSLIVIQPGSNSKKPFFFVAGGGGGEKEFLVYANLVRYLDPEQPVYGVKIRDFDNQQNPYPKLELMVADYVKEIEVVQSSGPYLIGGECVGGIIAFEIAQQLQAAGQKVALLVLFDAACPSNFVQLIYNLRNFFRSHFPIGLKILSRLSYWQRRLIHHLSQLFQLKPLAQLPYIFSKSSKVIGMILSKFDRRGKGSVDNKKSQPFPIPPAILESPKTPLNNQGKAYHNTGKLLLSYRPKIYPGKITLILNEALYQKLYYQGKQPTATYAYRHDRTLGWSQVATEGVDINSIPGKHLSYIRRNAHLAARKLQACIEKAQIYD